MKKRIQDIMTLLDKKGFTDENIVSLVIQAANGEVATVIVDSTTEHAVFLHAWGDGESAFRTLYRKPTVP